MLAAVFALPSPRSNEMLCPQEAAERLLAAVTRTVFSMTNQGLIGGRLLEIRTCGGAVRNAGCYTKFCTGRIPANYQASSALLG